MLFPTTRITLCVSPRRSSPRPRRVAKDLGARKMYGHVQTRKNAPSSWSSASTCAASTAAGADRDRLRQLQPVPAAQQAVTNRWLSLAR